MRLMITPNPRNAVAVGELLRDLFFDQNRGYGCYSTFDLRGGILTLPPVQNGEERWTLAMYMDPELKVTMGYWWDGDGSLAFLIQTPESTHLLYNSDCKKSSYWGWSPDPTPPWEWRSDV